MKKGQQCCWPDDHLILKRLVQDRDKTFLFGNRGEG